MTFRAWSVEHLLEQGASAGPILGIDTGSPQTSIGLVAGGRIRAVFARVLPSHCAGLPGAVDELLGDAGLRIRDLAGVGIAIGPGSFTGLRVGLSYAKGLAHAARFAIVGVPTLDAMALCAAIATGSSDRAYLRPGQQICPVLDARRGQVYAALYHFLADALEVEKETDDLAISPEELCQLIRNEAMFVGDAKAAEMQRTAAQKGCSATLLRPAELDRRGSMVAALAALKILRREVDRGAGLEPLYVRAPGVSCSIPP
jgi:tRNA threonylcarbamoyladenosine biosynthesis protein TsaB